MKKYIIPISLSLAALVITSCVHFMPLALDTAVDNDPYYTTDQTANAGDYVDKFTATDIYTDAFKRNNTWGTETDDCREFEVVTDVKKAGSSSLKITWSQSTKGCGWIGSGWAWNNWQAVDMSDIIDTWALRFWVRTVEGKMDNLSLMFNFIDDDSKSSETISTSSMFYEGSEITEEWKEVIIPLTYFRIKENGVTPSKIKQLIFALNGDGSIYFDEFQFIKIAEKEDAVATGTGTTTKSSASKNNTNFTATDVYIDFVKNCWGMESDDCRQFNPVSEPKVAGGAAMHLKWERSEKCGWIGSGWQWNNWQPCDMTKIINTWGLRFYARTVSGTMKDIPLSFNLTDMNDIGTENVSATNVFFEGDNLGEEWKEVIIPLYYFRAEELGVDITQIRQLMIIFGGWGPQEMYMDEMQFIPLPEHLLPNKPIGFPSEIFADALVDGWGFEKAEGKEFSVVTDVKKAGSSSLLMTWDKSKTGGERITTGFGWNNWAPIDLTTKVETMSLTFSVRTAEGTMPTLPLSFTLVDFDDKESETVTIDSKYLSGLTTGWTDVTIPLKDFKIFAKNLDPKKIMQLVINFEGSGKVYLDEMKLVE